MSSITVPAIQIKSIFVHTDGDASVGIGREGVQIHAEGDFIVDLENIDEAHRRPAIEKLRNQLESAFSELWDDKATVRYDFEVAAD